MKYRCGGFPLDRPPAPTLNFQQKTLVPGNVTLYAELPRKLILELYFYISLA